jgi:hypothetical protein
VSTRSATRLAWSLWGLTLALVPVAVTFTWLSRDLPLPEDREGYLPIVAGLCLIAVVYASVGALVASRRPSNAIGWIFIGIGFALCLLGSANGYADYVIFGDASLPLASYAAWCTSWGFVLPFFIAPSFVLLLFPDGRPPSPRWRPLVWALAALAALALIGLSFGSAATESYPGVRNPLAPGGRLGEALDVLETVGEAVVAPLVFLVALVAIVHRYRRSRHLERAQIKWAAYAAVVLMVCFIISFVAGEPGPAWVDDTLFFAATASFGGIAVASGIAILRYRLYDIDVVINRTLVYGSVTALLAGAYLGLVLLFQLAFSPLTEENSLAVALSTLAVAALFRPARKRVQELVDRRFYRRRYDAQRTLEGFASRLREEVDLDALRGELTSVVAETMQPAHVSLWLREVRS